MMVEGVEEGMKKVEEVGIDLPSMSDVSKSGMGIVGILIQILRENEIRMNFKDFKMDGELKFRLEPLREQ